MHARPHPGYIPRLTQMLMLTLYSFCFPGLAEAQSTGVAIRDAGTESRGKPLMPIDEAYAKILEAKSRQEDLKDFTAIFHIQEYKGRPLDEGVFFIKWRAKPRSVYLKYLTKDDYGQEVIWQEGVNSNKLKVHLARFPYLTVSLDPNGKLAMRESRHPVTDVGFERITKLVLRDLTLGKENPDYKIEIQPMGKRKIFNDQSLCFEAFTDKEKKPDFYGYRTVICYHSTLLLPHFLEIFDVEGGQLRRVEYYGYEDIKLNVGLTDHDFDPENSEYNF